jgi:hypothetical protein
MTITFKDRFDKTTVVKTDVNDKKEVFKAIDDFLAVRNVESPYMRLIGTLPNQTMIDYGSHSSFFFVDTDVENLINSN